jgi:hypothetical protein
MKNAEEADLRPEVPLVGSDFQQCCSAGFEQKLEQDPLVLTHQRNQRVRHAEDQVIVARRQQLLLSREKPLLARVGLALRAMAIAARVEKGGLMAAAITLIAVPAEQALRALNGR